MDNKTPKGWKSFKLKEIYDIKRGGSPRPIEKFITNNPDGINWIKIGDAQIGSKYIEKTKEKITKEGSEKSRFVEEGDFILSNSMSFGRPYIMKTRGCIHDGWLVLKEKQKDLVYRDFMYYMLSSNNVYSQFKNAATGGVVNNLNIQRVENVIVEIPSRIKEQREIAQVLDAMSEIVRLHEKCIQLAQDLIPALFQEMFGNFGQNTTRIKDICKIKGGKRLPLGEKLTENKTAHPYLRVTDFKNQSIDLKNLKYITEEIYQKISRYTISSQDIYISIAGTIGLVGEIPKILNNANLTENAAKLVILNKNINKKYLIYCLNSPYLQQQIKESTVGVGVPKLALTRIGELKVSLPPLELQEQFAQKAIEIENYIQEQEEELENAKQMFQSLLHHAFTGRLTSSTKVDLLTKQLVLHTKIIDKCYTQPTFGAVKLEKIFNICDMVQELNLAPIGYYRKAAGPYIPEMRHAVEKELEKRQWVKISNNKNGKRVKYKKDVKFSEYKNLYSQIFENKLNNIENIIQFFIDKDTDYCEAFSTLYMCWNDLLIEGKNPSKFEIIDEFKNHWAPEKQRFDRIYLLEILSDISNNNFEPHGQGKHTINSGYSNNKNQLKLI